MEENCYALKDANTLVKYTYFSFWFNLNNKFYLLKVVKC